MTGCIFCGTSPTTNQHVFGKKLGKILAQHPKGLSTDSIHRQISKTWGLREWKAARPLDYRANCVCDPCNSGWMEKIERQARPYVGQMILGQNVTLGENAQKAMADWITLTALVARYSHSPIDEVEPAWREYFFTKHEAPPSWYGWIASYDGRWPHYYKGNDVFLRHPNPSFVSTPHAVFMTLVIGHFVAQVFGIHSGTPDKSAPGVMFQVWPPVPDQVVNWPPQHTFDDTSLDFLAKRFFTEKSD